MPPDQASRCPHCGAFLFQGEAGALTRVTTKWCCSQGKELIPSLIPIQAPYYNSITGHALPAFLIRTLNGHFALSALRISGKWVQFGTGVANVKVHGRIMHKVSDLNWRGQHGPQESQLIIMDGSERQRIAESFQIEPTLYEDIHRYLTTHCHYFREYQRFAALPAANATLIFEKTRRQTHGPVLGDMPVSDEIAGIITTDTESRPRSVYVRKVGEEVERRISILDPVYEALQYPLLFPHGDAGWSPDFRSTTGQKVSLVDYVRQLFLREGRFTRLDRLPQEFGVDMFSRVEENRLQFFRSPEGQASLRMGSRDEIAGRLGEQNEEGLAAGRIYLPSGFIGGPRYMRQLFQDAMAIVMRYCIFVFKLQSYQNGLIQVRAAHAFRYIHV